MEYAQKRLTNRTDVFKFLCAGFFRIIFPKKTGRKNYSDQKRSGTGQEKRAEKYSALVDQLLVDVQLRAKFTFSLMRP